MKNNLNDTELWDLSVDFHGHICGGLTIGYKAALYAKELLELTFSEDEAVVCVTENDACGVDAISVILGCSVGKGNLLFKLRGKQAFSFFNRKTGKSVRLVLNDLVKKEGSKDERQKIMFEMPYKDLFDVKDVNFEIPERAFIFNSIICESCGEKTSENYIRIENGKQVCIDCFHGYTRFF